jgi:diguanylate cyclase (GGDEF)-like protein/PAS domain S-box-containing protein
MNASDATPLNGASRRDEKTLETLVAAIAGATGQCLMDNLVRWTASWLEADACLIGELKSPTQVETVAAFAHGQAVTNFSYQLAHPPCAEVLLSQTCDQCAKELEGELATLDCDASLPAELSLPHRLALPIIDRQSGLRGLFAVYSLQALRLTPQRHKMLELLATMAASEIERRSVEAQLRRRDSILDAVSFCSSLLLRAERLDQVINTVVERLGQAAEVSRTSVFENSVDAGGELLCNLRYEWVAKGISPQIDNPWQQNSIYRAGGFERWPEVLGSHQIIAGPVRDLPPRERAVLSQGDIKSTLVAPIFIDGGWWGFISFDDCEQEREWSVHEVGALLAAASVIASAIQRRQGEKRQRQAATMFENTIQGVVITDRNGNIEAVNQAFTDITGYSEAEVLGQNPRILNSGRHSKEFYAELWQAVLANGRWRGEIWNRRKNGEVYPELLTISTVKDQNNAILNYIAVFSDISEIKEAQRQLDYLANHDPLTELPNRRLFQEVLDHTISHSRGGPQMVGVLVFDLDRFKQINDSLGHPIGDTLLQEVAKRLQHSLRRGDMLARLGGDQFALLVEAVHDAQQLGKIARQLLDALASRPVAIQGHEFYTTASVGIALWPDDGKDVQKLIRNAESAMYQAKEQGRNTYHYYSAELTASSFERLLMETHLRQAVDRNELVLHYQPQVLLESGAIVGAEALIRWQHPELGPISPGKFIPVAEESGLIVPIGAWVLRTACRQAKQWRDAGLPLQSISVNIAGPQFERAEFVGTVRQALDETGLEPEMLELEITETFISRRIDHALAVLEELRRLGVKLAIDDFGTGYSSMMYLKRLPIDKLKIDRSFIHGLPDDQEDVAIAKAIIALGKSMDFIVIAEGIETPEQQAFLLREACDQGQGFLHSRPIPAEDFERLMHPM